MTATNGWYCKVLLNSESEAKTRWAIIENNMLLFYTNTADKVPVNIFHVDGLEVSEAFGEIDQLHSLKVKINHVCAIPQFFVYTPNQFDIVSIKKGILDTQAQWKTSITQSKPTVPQNFVTDTIGKFVYKPADRCELTIDSDKLTIKSKDTADKVMLLNDKFDCYPLNDPTKDQKWVSFQYFDNKQCSYQTHCENVQKLTALVNLALHCKYSQ
ncbi:hypothetical protein TRFO_15224 [Tritrichomonas foetus]|uniref:PH domain-containing protein n=1 Tax=Tritrichomonas foetus TaxID=1144522 RepID=A0A1J4KT08_9EUKA|nr:hypothetical protein TRFO_15224 [Tritrichomonas foetus]|eukprot:OHT14433.1 hypothetical protein TRFO_15224 [Tritrichomonas foetus]